MKRGALYCLIPCKAPKTFGEGKNASDIHLPVLLKEPLKGATAWSPVQPYRDLVIGGWVVRRKVPKVELAGLVGVGRNGKQARIRFTNVKLLPDQQTLSSPVTMDIYHHRTETSGILVPSTTNSVKLLASTHQMQRSFFFSSLVAFAVGARLLNGGDEAWWVSCFLGAMRGAGLGRVLPTWAALRAVTEQAAPSNARQNGRCILKMKEREAKGRIRGKVGSTHARDDPSFEQIYSLLVLNDQPRGSS